MNNGNLYLTVPAGDSAYASMIAQKRGWIIEDGGELLRDFVKSLPDDVPITEDEIMDEVRAVRYGK